MFEREERFAAGIARAAGAVVMRWYAGKVSVEWKGKGDPVTEADRESNSLVVDAIRREFPDDGILAEESEDDGSRLGRPRLWLVDPLDGTREFVDRNGEFVVMVALAERGVPVAGAVFHPVSGRLFRARAGGGAWVEEDGDERRLAVSPVSDLATARLLVSRSHRSPGIDAVKRLLGVGLDEPCGSVGLKVARLAEGRAELYVHAGGGTKEWDVAAPEILLREAGGAITDGAGRPLEYNRPDVRTPRLLVAGSGVLHAEAVRRLASLDVPS